MDSHPTSPAVARRTSGLFYGWYIVSASVAMNIYLSVAFFQGFQAFFLPILNEFGWSRTLMSGAFSLRQLESGLLSPAVGFAADRWGPRKAIFLGVILAGFGLASMALISAPWMLYVAFLVTSVGMSGASHGITWTVAVANWFRRLRGRALGMAYLGPVVGGPLVVLVVVLEEAVGWRAALMLLGIGLWIVGIPLSLVARNRPEQYGYLPDGDHQEKPVRDNPAQVSTAARRPEGIAGLDVRTALHMPAFWLVSGIFAIQGLGVSGVMVHQVPLFQSLGFSARESAAIVGLTFFLSGIGRLGTGVLMDRFPARLVVIGLTLTQMASYGFLASAGAVWWQVFLFSLTFGVAFGGSIPARPMMIRELFGDKAFGAINGLAQGLSIAMGMVGPLIMGIVFDLTGAYTPAIIFFALVTASVLPLVLTLQPAEPESLAAPQRLAERLYGSRSQEPHGPTALTSVCARRVSPAAKVSAGPEAVEQESL